MEPQERHRTTVEALHITLQATEPQEARQIMGEVQVIHPSVMVTQELPAIMVGVQPITTMIRFQELPAIMVEALHTIQSHKKRSPQVFGMISRFSN